MSVSILVGDCRATLGDMLDESVDAVVADPPYNQTTLDWDRWPDGWPTAVRRVLRRGGSMWVFGSLRMFMERRDEFVGWRMAQDIVWEKHNGSGFQADRFRRVHEQAVQFYRDDASWADVWKGKVVTMDAVARSVTGRGKPQHMGVIGDRAYRTEEGGPRIMRSVIYCRSEHGRAVHPTQKPIGIVEPLILNCCPIGGTVLDPFAGSGTTGVAAARLSRNAILIEADPTYASLARERINADGGMFAGAAS